MLYSIAYIADIVKRVFLKKREKGFFEQKKLCLELIIQ